VSLVYDHTIPSSDFQDQEESVEYILTAVDSDLSAAWDRFCGDLPNVRQHAGSILDVKCDAIVAPVNSFGFMDGGIDALYIRHFGSDLQHRVHSLIHHKHCGELPVGVADILETANEEIPYLVLAPTMRVPMVLRESVNTYLAARAVFLLLQQGTFGSGPHSGKPVREHITKIAFPGLGTGVGQMAPSVCAHQFRAAFEDVVLGKFSPPSSWADASERHQLLYTDRPRNLQRL
jgi:O-acetyl-ADP-ribose deacetylase (regulator of RNase III)